MNMCLRYVSYHQKVKNLTTPSACFWRTQNNLWPFRTFFPISHVVYHFTCHLNGTIISCVVWTRHHVIMSCPFAVNAALSRKDWGDLSAAWLLTSARCSSSSCCCTWRWTASSFSDMLDEHFCSDVRFLDKCWACSTNFSSDTIDGHSFH